MSFKWEDNGYQPKGSDVEATPPKGGSAMQEEIVKPMNPYATQDFKNAVKGAMDDLNKRLNKVGEQMREAFSYMDDPCEMVTEDSREYYREYCGIMRVSTASMWRSLIEMLMKEGYQITAKFEDATKTERELDEADKFVVIEYREIE